MEKKDGGLLEVIQEYKKREPFERFMIVMSSGDRHVIESGDLMVITPSQIIYAYPKSDRVVFMRISQISSVEQLEQRPAA
jgi:hypothetical protein